ncbi:metallophosphoesterase family protein [Caldivirga sp. UBA161]|uniref:metallophosphoesterase family protein n=1 Tax=Caldivirga sp. UBA161 TaxID=1915569 RepID=UPI0025BBBBFD|nr:metallophosphoesterase [Caldivirga sp. UBA161]
MSKLKLLLVSDLHGSETAYRKLANAVKYYKVDAVIFAGDLAGKVLVPVIRINDSYKIPLISEDKLLKGSEAEGKIKELRGSGYHVRVVTEEEYERMRNDKDYLNKVFNETLTNDIVEYLNVIDEKYRQQGVKMYIIPGNDDPIDVINGVNSRQWSSIIPFDENVVNLNSHMLVGFGYSNITPWNTHRELSEGEMYERLSKLMNKLDKGEYSRTILVVHAPPHGTVIDQAPMLTSDFKVVRRGGEAVLTHVGSTSVRRIIEEYKPLMGLHGHIHESGGVDAIKVNGAKILVFNAGSEYQFGVLRGIIISIDGNKVNYIPVRG